MANLIVVLKQNWISQISFVFFRFIHYKCTHSEFLLFHLGFKASSEIQWVRPPTQWTDGDRFGAHILSTGKHSWHFTVNSDADALLTWQTRLHCSLSKQFNPSEECWEFNVSLCIHKCVYNMSNRLNSTNSFIFSLPVPKFVVLFCNQWCYSLCCRGDRKRCRVCRQQFSKCNLTLCRNESLLESPKQKLFMTQCYRFEVIDPACILSVCGWGKLDMLHKLWTNVGQVDKWEEIYYI